MAKKKRTSSAPSVAETTPAVPSDDLKTLIREHSLFFDRLVELIPARFYLPSDDTDKPWFQGLSKAAKASAKKETRENIKKARRDRLDPEKAATTLDLLKRNIEAEKDPSSQVSEAGGGEAKGKLLKIPDDRTVTYEELRQRLRRKIEELRGNRNTRDPDRPNNERGDRNNKKDEALLGKHGKDDRKFDEVVENDAKKPKKDASGVDLSFGHVKIGDRGEKIGKRKGLSKKAELERAEKLQESMKDPEKGKEVRKKHLWKAAVSKAAGGKVHDDPKLIRESMKKEKKRHEKSVEKWKERVETTRKMKVEKQKKRVENINEKIEKKKMKRIDKREKKLMRPGFEGRKEGYINES